MTFDASDEPYRRYAWAQAEEAFCFTFVQGMTVAEAVGLFPSAPPQRVGYDELSELAYDVWDGDEAGLVCVGGVTALRDTGWLLVVEINGYGGTLPEVRRALARRGYVMSFSTNVNSLMSIRGTAHGEAQDTVEMYPVVVERVSIEAPTPALAAGDIAAAMREAGLLTEDEFDALESPDAYYGTVDARCLAFCELATGVAVTEQDVRDATFDVVRIPV